MTAPLVSIIMPVYNRANLIARAIDSVLAQTYPHWELLIVDDGSTDHTRRVIEAYGDRVRLLTQANQGPYPARNLALQQARGELVAFIDSDDRWFPDRLARQVPLFARPEVGLVYSNSALVEYASGSFRRLDRTFFDLFAPCRGQALTELKRANCIPQSSVLVRRACFDQLGGFSLASRTSADYAKWVQIAQHYELDYVPECLIEYTFHTGNISSGALRAYFAPVALFEELIQSAPDAHRQTDLRRLAAYFEWNLAVALMLEAVRHFRAAKGLQTVPAARRWRWFAGYWWDKVARRLRPRPRWSPPGLDQSSPQADSPE